MGLSAMKCSAQGHSELVSEPELSPLPHTVLGGGGGGRVTDSLVTVQTIPEISHKMLPF